ncbi:hypothetical protein BJ684DRAFT_9096 [Piptocephalis cylindrospora]|uniref:Xanthine dehydrogenase n=1 Tax=Piptocephalis cylindrospora TaxID=1907219 RepID=A0A4V1IYC7_9FUNG|nr:hypothetical protein BJ684DRAFT_9096 [Piptocephalis cylindrospora]|eukprot:RKP14099.1 hypothetical protein BJ684DRAFT_9096 [Piptocephalis cylindrospora]
MTIPSLALGSGTKTVQYTAPQDPLQPSTLLFYLNGRKALLTQPPPDLTLLQYIRSIGLTGSKLGCGEGGCGACTVLVSSYDLATQAIRHIPVNACLSPLASVQGKHVITIEALGTSANPHPVQERIAQMHGSQCGFCTPGIVMSMYALLRTNPRPTEEEIEEAFDGNLCRCTGYRPILDAAKTFSVEKTGVCCKSGKGADNGGKGCCMDEGSRAQDPHMEEAKYQRGGGGCCKDTSASGGAPELIPSKVQKIDSSFQYQPYDPSRELIFPPALILLAKEGGHGCTWYHPHSLLDAMRLRKLHPTARIIAGNTEVGVEMRAKRSREEISIYLSADAIPGLGKIDVDESQGLVSFGGNLTLDRFSHHLFTTVVNWPAYEREHYMVLHEALKYFAGRQIRSVATLAGNLATASPISDLSPVWMALDAHVELGWLDITIHKKWVPIRDFFLGYRKTLLNPAQELILSFRIRQKSRKGEYVRTYKVSRRKDDDIALVNAAVSLKMDEKTGTISSSYVAYGGMAPVPLKAEAMSDVCVGRTVDEVSKELAIFLDDFSGINLGTPGGMPSYRLVLAVSLYHRLLAQCLSSHLSYFPEHSSVRIPHDLTQGLEARVSRGAQSYDSSGAEKEDAHGEAVAHLAAMKQTCGEAEYLDDQTPPIE